ncbi:uncharacterized protein SEPMUDRAFT_129039 [Sphaerulina musiva SO2202]|uniref:Uncharacterized protein n=1 Tax=Sphaerulina musiva (strain SO2202) TaxID=692275 RepID=M3CWJ4_SPHMS|nr:uncharacterized protein SEPMUDRAFT_129039 [Sphaerulina musiva SO2202]EMF08041.1 hypothetical protein SEPMUDRAFT_129039 [Sphaerulina musiva SO2202]
MLLKSSKTTEKDMMSKMCACERRRRRKKTRRGKICDLVHDTHVLTPHDSSGQFVPESVHI